MPFSAFWGEILQNSEDYKTSYEIHKMQHISGIPIQLAVIFREKRGVSYYKVH